MRSVQRGRNLPAPDDCSLTQYSRSGQVLRQSEHVGRPIQRLVVASPSIVTVFMMLKFPETDHFARYAPPTNKYSLSLRFPAFMKAADGKEYLTRRWVISWTPLLTR